MPLCILDFEVPVSGLEPEEGISQDCQGHHGNASLSSILGESLRVCLVGSMACHDEPRDVVVLVIFDKR